MVTEIAIFDASVVFQLGAAICCETGVVLQILEYGYLCVIHM
jgi:hypothetical protein